MPNPVVKLVIERGTALAFQSGSRVSPVNAKVIFTTEIPEGYVEVAPSENPGVLEVRLEPPRVPGIAGRATRYREKQAAKKVLATLDAEKSRE